jgi:hypothetical protein
MAVVASIALVEVGRYIYVPEIYVGNWRWILIAAIAVNVAFHLMSLPDARWKACVSAFMSQPSLWFFVTTVGIYLWRFVAATKVIWDGFMREILAP